MKKGIMYILIVLLLFSYKTIEGYEYHKEVTIIEQLLNERITIMNDFLYNGKDLKDLEEKLNKIEAGDQLENDLDILSKVIDNPTDFELSKNVKVEKINKLDKTEDGIDINADLNWLIEGYDGEYNLIKNYNIKCLECNNIIYLSMLKYVENE
ncbi:hypothetical protein [Sedimentibacter sp. MB31-C6]|uniref:hypothetical protein n=1 Tax=Sedimentibacter sp. MB31-C6 TaxID=3109366 RepID=UPI002DDD8537|nr:hypothetical protein [Sedimentibacter sp. MB36-C1]WSI04934.1 hypothetical protein U8307_03850 [Sedimentibacter sp. MB36-C1]